MYKRYFASKYYPLSVCLNHSTSLVFGSITPHICGILVFGHFLLLPTLHLYVSSFFSFFDSLCLHTHPLTFVSYCGRVFALILALVPLLGGFLPSSFFVCIFCSTCKGYSMPYEFVVTPQLTSL